MRAWPVEAHYWPAVALHEVMSVNDDPENTGQSYQYTVKNQFLEVTNQWDSAGTYFYFHVLPSGMSQLTIPDADKQSARAIDLLQDGKLYCDHLECR